MVRKSFASFSLDLNVGFYYNKNNNYYLRCGVYVVVCTVGTVKSNGFRTVNDPCEYVYACDRSNHWVNHWAQ